MITVDFVNKAISGVIDRFKEKDYIRYTYHEVICEEGHPEEIHFFIEDELNTLLDGLNIEHTVKLIDMGDYRWYTSCIFNVDGEKQVRSFVVERRF